MGFINHSRHDRLYLEISEKLFCQNNLILAGIEALSKEFAE